MWWGIYDGQHQKIVKLEKELVRTQERLRLKEQECYEASWTLQELTNGAGRAAMNLYKARRCTGNVFPPVSSQSGCLYCDF
jgi:hypothetical protein